MGDSKLLSSREEASLSRAAWYFFAASVLYLLKPLTWFFLASGSFSNFESRNGGWCLTVAWVLRHIEDKKDSSPFAYSCVCGKRIVRCGWGVGSMGDSCTG